MAILYFKFEIRDLEQFHINYESVNRSYVFEVLDKKFNSNFIFQILNEEFNINFIFKILDVQVTG